MKVLVVSRWGDVAAAALASTLLMASTSAGAVQIYGSFLGTWQQSPPALTGMPNPQGGNFGPPAVAPNASNVEGVGNAILAQYPGLFDIDEFLFAGSYDNGNFFTGTEGLVFTPVSDSTYAWTYQGFDSDPPGDDPVDLFIAVNFGTNTSVFHFYDPHVNPGDTGFVSTDIAYLLANTPDALEAGLGYAGISPTCSFVDGFDANCLPRVGGQTGDQNPIRISHAVGYWPPVDGEVPEPGMMTLFGLGLLGLGAARRRMVRR